MMSSNERKKERRPLEVGKSQYILMDDYRKMRMLSFNPFLKNDFSVRLTLTPHLLVLCTGEPVEAELCEEDPPPSEVSCEMACPGDCVVSSWSDWSSCSHSCTNKNAEGRQSRMRTILALPGEGNTYSLIHSLTHSSTSSHWMKEIWFNHAKGSLGVHSSI